MRRSSCIKDIGVHKVLSFRLVRCNCHPQRFGNRRVNIRQIRMHTTHIKKNGIIGGNFSIHVPIIRIFKSRIVFHQKVKPGDFRFYHIDWQIVDESQRRIVGLMEDHRFRSCIIIATPIVADRIHVTESVVIQFVIHAAIAVVVQHIVARIFNRSHIHVMVIDSRYAPKVASNDIVAQLGSASRIGTVDANTTAAIVRSYFQIIVNKLIINDIRRDFKSVLGVSVAVVDNHVVLQQQLRDVRIAHVHDADAARHVAGHALNAVADDANRVCCARSDIDLRRIGVT